jgi:hypothetical protein
LEATTLVLLAAHLCNWPDVDVTLVACLAEWQGFGLTMSVLQMPL